MELHIKESLKQWAMMRPGESNQLRIQAVLASTRHLSEKDMVGRYFEDTWKHPIRGCFVVLQGVVSPVSAS